MRRPRRRNHFLDANGCDVLANAGDAAGARDVRFDGVVSALSGTCPAVTFTASRTMVISSSTTTFDGGCAAIVNGALVSVTGTRQTDGSVTAARVSVRETEVEGAMAGVTGACPALTFTLGATAVTMNAATVLDGVACAQLVNGANVRVDGFKRADGSILASTIAAGHR